MFNEYFDLQTKIHEHFDYVEDWSVIPLVDHREFYWQLHQDENGSGVVIYSEDPLTEELLESLKYYEAEIYKQRHPPKWVYRTDKKHNDLHGHSL